MRDQAITKERPAIARGLGYSLRLLNLTAALVSLLNTGLSLQANPGGPNGQQQAAHVFQSVAPGVEHSKVTRGAKSDNEATGPWVINLLRVDPEQVDLRIAHALDEGVGLENTSSIAARAGAIAAVNAGFFRTTGTYRGESSGVLAMGRNLLSEPIEGRAAFGLIKHPKSTEVIFGHLKFSGYVETRGLRHVINGLNRPRGADELIIYTPAFHRTTLTNPDGVEAIVQRSKIVRVRDQTGSTMIPANGVVISAAGTAREWVMANLRTGSRVRIQTKLVPIETEMSERWSRASFIVGGGPQLIKGGIAAITTEAEGIAARFETDRHPRTAIAKLKDGRILLATVDGRQPGVSVGMSLSELASLLLEFGAVGAINLDGGGSTTMVIGGTLVNKPSDPTGERPVSDAILILPRSLLSKPRID